MLKTYWPSQKKCEIRASRKINWYNRVQSGKFETSGRKKTEQKHVLRLAQNEIISVNFLTAALTNWRVEYGPLNGLQCVSETPMKKNLPKKRKMGVNLQDSIVSRIRCRSHGSVPDPAERMSSVSVRERETPRESRKIQWLRSPRFFVRIKMYRSEKIASNAQPLKPRIQKETTRATSTRKSELWRRGKQYNNNW